MGTGHVMRCLALAQAWQEIGGRAIFALATKTSALEARLAEESMEVAHLSTQPGNQKDSEQTIDLAQREKALWVVLDGYHFNADYQKPIKQAGLNLLFIDDYGHADHYFADLVLNQNIYANKSLYRKREPYTELLLGTQYVLLRREFWLWRGWQRQIPEVARKVLVTLGGGDPDNVTLKVIRALQQLDVPGLEAKIVVGPVNVHLETLRKVTQTSTFNMQLLTEVPNMPELMVWADIAISAGGSTCWELALMGLPSVLLVVAENQRRIAKGLDQAGMAINLGWFNRISRIKISTELVKLLNARRRRQQMSQTGQQSVDGKGAYRVIEALRTSVPVMET